VAVSGAAAVAYAAVTLVVVGFQLALAAGAPWGAYAMGGSRPGRFPPALRVAAVVQAVVLALLAVVVVSRAGVAFVGLLDGVPWLVWVPVAVGALSLALNAASRSAGERRLWVPVAAVLLASSLVVALGA
jgi:hypothetical protein